MHFFKCAFVCAVSFSPLPSCEDCLPAAASAGKAASYKVPKEEEFRQLGCGGQPCLVNEPLASAACEDAEEKDFTPLEFVSLFGGTRLLNDC